MKLLTKAGKWSLRFLSLLAVLMLFGIPAMAGVQEAAGEYEIYPTPQEVTYGTGNVQITDEVKLNIGSGIDSYTEDRIQATLEVLKLTGNKNAGAGKTNLTVGIWDSADAADLYGKANGADAALFAKNDAYMLMAKGSDIVILGKNTDAAYLGVTTLKHIFEQLSDKSMKELTVKDYSEIEFRGFIEGYYGNPWSMEDRVDLMKFGSEIKMNQYIFAPKDDPYHNARWRQLYPEAELQKIKQLAQAGNESKCFFVYALHPFMNSAINLSDATYESEVTILKAKFRQVIEHAGVRQIAILEDDAEGTTAQRMIRLLNDMNEWLHTLKETEFPDLKTELLYCPTCYMATTNSKMTTIGAGVSSEIHILVTGGKIWGEVSSEFADAFYAGMSSGGAQGRYPYMWVNWPCNDNTKTSQIMGGHNTILHTGVDGSKYEGLVLNPIQESEPSKVGIFTAADYCWQTWDSAEEGDQAWEDAFKYIDHMTPIESDSSNDLKEIAKHMIAQGPGQITPGKQQPFEESVELSPKLAAFTQSLNAGTLTAEEIAGLKSELAKIHAAAVNYMEKGTNRRMASQMTPFLSCLRDLTEAGSYLMDALQADLDGSSNDIWENFAEAQAIYEQSHSYGFQYYGQGTIYAQAGRKYIAPFVETVMKYVSDTVQQILDPEHIKLEESLIFQAGGSTGEAESGSIANATDGSLATNVQFQRIQVAGDYVGLLFNKLVPVKNIEIYLACEGHANDYIPNGVMEYTVDGKTWTAFETQPQDAAADVKLSFEEKEIKGFRWRGTSIDKNRWLIIREIAYNTEEKGGSTQTEAYAATASYISRWSIYQNNVLANLTDGNDGTFTWFDTGTDDTTMKDDWIQLDLGSVKEVGRVRVLVGAGDEDKWTQYHLEYSTNGTTWEKLPSYTGKEGGLDTYEVNLQKKSARYIRLVNDVQLHKWVKFSEFSVYPYVEGEEQPGEPINYTNTAADTGLRAEYEPSVSRILPKTGVVLKPGEYIGLKLDRLHEVTSFTVTGSSMEALTKEQSANQTVWTDSKPSSAARYFRLINKTNADVTFNLDSFVVETSELESAHLEETTLGASSDALDPRNNGTDGYWFDGNLSTAAKYCVTPRKDQYILYALGQERKLHSIRVYVDDTDVDYPRDAVIEASADGTNWETILTIGDGVQNTGDGDTKPAENGWTHDSVDVAYSYMENKGFDVTANYIRMRFTANYTLRWVRVNEIRLNDGEYVRTINDPTFVTDPIEVPGFAPQNLNDCNFTTAFKPNMEGKTSGSLIYRLSDTTKINKLNILQSGKSISNAKVSVRTDANADTWKELGVLDQSLNSFYTEDLEDIYEVKLEWGDVTPVIYEIIALEGAGDGAEVEKLKKELAAAEKDAAASESEAAKAGEAAAEAATGAADAAAKVNAAANAADKLKAEAALAEAEAKKAGAEATEAEKKAELAEKEAAVLDIEAQILRAKAARAASEAEKAQLEADAKAKEDAAAVKRKEAAELKAFAGNKKQAQTAFEQQAAAKLAELEKLQQGGGTGQTPGVDQPTVTETVFKNVKYKVLNASAKTATAYAPKDKKIKKAVIAKTVNIGGTVYKVTQISPKAFKGCKTLKKVTIGANVQTIGQSAFDGCKKLANVNMKKATKIKTFGRKAFRKISAKAKVKVPAKKLKAYQKKLKRTGLPKKAKIKK